MQPLTPLKPFVRLGSMLIIGLALSVPMTPPAAIAHVGHGDEFQSQGGVQRVKLNPETDQMLGIVVTPIAATEGGVMIPVTAVVDADGKKLVFVQYDKFYEPVPIATGATNGELIAVTQGLSAGEKLVTQGSLSLYAESRKTQSAPVASASPAGSQADQTHAQADAKGIPHSHDASGAMSKSGIALGLITVAGGGVAVLGAVLLINGKRKKQGSFSNKNDREY